MNYQIWTYKNFLKCVLPSILSMIYISLFIIVDSYFVSKHIGIQALAAVNIIHPIYNITLGFAVMLSIGGSALIAIELGKGQSQEANNDFSLISLSIFIIIIVLSLISFVNLDMILKILGVQEALYQYAFNYAQIIIITMPFLGLKVNYEFFLRVDNKGSYSLLLTILGGTINMILDYIFIGHLKLGIIGAGIATFIGIVIPVLIGAYYFTKISKTLHYTKPIFKSNFLMDASLNGMSEMITEFSCAITTALFNIALLKYIGVKGVAANAVLMYIFSIYVAIVLGINLGAQPAISYNFGAKNYKSIKTITQYVVKTMLSISVILYILLNTLGKYPVVIFLKNDPEAVTIALSAIPIFSLSLLIAGINIFSSGYYTAINNSQRSAFISFSRSIIILIPLIILLPRLFSVTGIWLTKPMTEIITLCVSLHLISKDRFLWSKNV